MNITGIFHIHSAYSYDSEFSLSGIKECLIRLGCGFGVICDHQKDLDQERYAALRKDCERISSDDFRLIPGLEFEFNTVHILGVGLKEYFKPDTIGGCLETIKSQKGLAVWAHPLRKDAAVLEPHLEMLNGVEVWSARYGTKYAPSVSLCKTVTEWRKKQPDLWAYAGLDAHSEEEIKDLYVEMDVAKLNESRILEGFSNGRFILRFKFFRLCPHANLYTWQKIIFPILFSGYKEIEKIIDRSK